MVFIRDLSGNADAGTATKWGGNQITLIDNLFDNVDISASIVNGTGKVRMATAWYFRSGKLELRNPADTFSYIFAGSAIGANRTITVPLLTGNANMVLDAFANVFTAVQEIQVNSNDPFTLYKPINTNLTTWDLNFDANDSGSNKTTYADLRATIIDNTNGSEDGRFTVQVQIAGTKREVFRLQDNNTTLFNSISNANGTNTQLEFLGLDSGSAEHAYAMIRSEIVDNTGGSEDGRLEFLTSDGGTLTESFIIHNNGDVDITRGALDILDDGNADMLDLERSDGTVGNQNGINFWLEDSTAALHKYGRIHSVIVTNTNGAEDGDIVFSASDAGAFVEVARIIGGSKQFRVVGDEWETIDIYRPNSTVDNDTAGLMFSKNNSSAARVGIGFIEGNLKDNTAGAEDSSMQFWTRRAGANKRVMNVDHWGVLTIGPDSSNAGTVSRNVIRSGTAVNFNNTSAEQTLFSQNILANTLSAHGHLHLIILGSIRQQTATSTTYTLRCKFGGTTYYEDAVLSAYTTSSANYLIYQFELFLYNTGVTNAQGAHIRWMLGDSGGVPTTGWGDITDDEIQGNANGAFNPNQDTTIDRTLAVTMQMSTASTSCEVNVDYKWLEINP